MGQSILTATVNKDWRVYIRDCIEITKPGINRSNLFSAITGYVLATRFVEFDFLTFTLLMLGISFVIAGSCALNNAYDVEIDRIMSRTQDRALPRGRLSRSFAVYYGISLVVLGLISLSCISYLVAILGFVGFFVYVVIYTMWLKRTSIYNTVIGGVCGSVPPMMGWVAVTGQLDFTAWALFLLLFIWQPAHFFALALLKEEDYRNAGIPMLPVIKGTLRTKIEILIFTVLLLPVSLSFFYAEVVGSIYLTVAVFLWLIYIYLSLRGFSSDIAIERWARIMFLYSIIYLMLIMLALIIDVAWSYFN